MRFSRNRKKKFNLCYAQLCVSPLPVQYVENISSYDKIVKKTKSEKIICKFVLIFRAEPAPNPHLCNVFVGF